MSGINSAELGASIAEQYGRVIGPVHRQLCMSDDLSSRASSYHISLASLASLSRRDIDAAKAFSSQIAIKGYFAGEAAGIRLANRES